MVHVTRVRASDQDRTREQEQRELEHIDLLRGSYASMDQDNQISKSAEGSDWRNEGEKLQLTSS